MAIRLELLDPGLVGVPHDHQVEVGLAAKQISRPVGLAPGGGGQPVGVRRVVAEVGTQQLDQAESDLGVDRPVDGGGDRVIDGPMEEGRPELRLGQPIAVDGCDSASPDAAWQSVPISRS